MWPWHPQEKTAEAPTQETPRPTIRPFTLSDEEIRRVSRLVNQFLTPEYDREYIADTIVLNAWLRDVPHISREYVKHKCISAWRKMKREKERNEARR